MKPLAAVLFATTLVLAGCAPPVLPVRLPPAAADEPAHQTESFQGALGTLLFAQSWHPKDPARAVVVIRHGLKSHSAHYDAFARKLVELGFAVYAYDMRGHGRSAGRRASLDDFDGLLDDLSTFLARVRARETAPMFLVGHSVGGAVVTLHLVERHPPLAGAVLLAPALRVDAPPIQAGAVPLTATLLPNFPVVDVPDEAFSRDPAFVADMGRDPLLYHPVGPARTAGGLVRALERVWAHPDAIDLPLLVLHGTADRATDPRGSAELVRRVRSSDRTLLLYRGLYHDLFHEPEREQVIGDVIAWLTKHVPSSESDSAK
jgi:alpha-beta hydrolase superfamily lysophospholipase